MKKLSLYLILAPFSKQCTAFLNLCAARSFAAHRDVHRFCCARCARSRRQEKRIATSVLCVSVGKEEPVLQFPKKAEAASVNSISCSQACWKIEEITQIKDDIWTISALCYYCPFIIIGLFGPAYFWNSKVRHVKTSIKNLSNKIGQKKAR